MIEKKKNYRVIEDFYSYNNCRIINKNDLKIGYRKWIE